MDLLKVAGTSMLIMAGVGLVIIGILLPGKVIERRRKRAAEHPPASDGVPFFGDAEVDANLRVPVGQAAHDDPTPVALAAFDTVPWTPEGIAGSQVEVWSPWGFESPEFEGTWRKTRREMDRWDTKTRCTVSIPAATTSRLVRAQRELSLASS